MHAIASIFLELLVNLPYPPRQRSTSNCSYTNTLTPILTLPMTGTKLHTTLAIGLKPQKHCSKKGPKERKQGQSCFDMPLIGHKSAMVTPLHNHSCTICSMHQSSKAATHNVQAVQQGAVRYSHTLFELS